MKCELCWKRRPENRALEEYDRRVMLSQWVGAATEPLARARQLQRTSERLRAQDEFGIELSPEATARA